MPDTETIPAEELLRMTSEVAAAYVSNNNLPSGQLPDVIRTIHDNFAHIAQSSCADAMTCVQGSRRTTPAAASRRTTIHGASFQTVSSRKPASATAKSRGVSTALVHTGL